MYVGGTIDSEEFFHLCYDMGMVKPSCVLVCTSPGYLHVHVRFVGADIRGLSDGLHLVIQSSNGTHCAYYQ